MGGSEEVVQRLDVLLLAVLSDILEGDERIPDTRRLRALLYRRARELGIALAVGLGALEDVVAPAHAGLVEEVGDVRPGEADLPGRNGRIHDIARARERIRAARA